MAWDEQSMTACVETCYRMCDLTRFSKCLKAERELSPISHFLSQVPGKKMLPALKYKCSGDGLLPSLTTETPRSCYTSSYGKPNAEKPLKHVRYPHEHTLRSSEAQRHYNPKNPTILTSFGASYRTPLHVLAVTQEPFSRANTWVYSQKPKVYNRLLGP